MRLEERVARGDLDAAVGGGHVGQALEGLQPAPALGVGDAQHLGGLDQRLAQPADQREVAGRVGGVARDRALAPLGRVAQGDVQAAVLALLEQPEVGRHGPAHHGQRLRAQEGLVARVEPVQPVVVGEPGDVPRPELDAVIAVDALTAGADGAARVQAVEAEEAAALLPPARQAAAEGLVEGQARVEMVRGVDRPVALLHVHVEVIVAAPRGHDPVRGPQALQRDGQAPRARRAAELVHLHVEQVLQPLVGDGQEARAPPVGPPGAVAVPSSPRVLGRMVDEPQGFGQRILGVVMAQDRDGDEELAAVDLVHLPRDDILAARGEAQAQPVRPALAAGLRAS